MKILVTGGLGFMGSNFIRHMMEAHPDVQILNVDKMTYAGNPENLRDVEKDPRYTFLKADIADHVAVDTAVQEFHPDVIVNYAAETHVDRSILDPEAFIRTDIFGTYNLLESVRKYSIPRYIQISTDEVFGSIEEGEFTEETAFDPSSPYSASKAGADHLVRAYHRTFGTPTIVTHACNNYGPYQYPEKLIPLFVTNLLEGKKVPVYGAGTNIREWIYVADHARAIDTILRNGEIGGVYNIGTGERLTNIDITHRLLTALGKDELSIERVADRPGHDLRYAVDATKLRALGWDPLCDFQKGLQKTIDWYRSHEAWWKQIKSGEYLEYYKRQYDNQTTKV